jgi:hypothetical protein
MHESLIAVLKRMASPLPLGKSSESRFRNRAVRAAAYASVRVAANGYFSLAVSSWAHPSADAAMERNRSDVNTLFADDSSVNSALFKASGGLVLSPKADTIPP